LSKLPLSIRIGSLAHEVELAVDSLRLLTEAMRAPGIARIMSVPAALGAMAGLLGRGGADALLARGWRTSPWSHMISPFIRGTLNPKSAVQVRQSHGVPLLIWWDEGIAIEDEIMWLAPDGRPERWLRNTVANWDTIEMVPSNSGRNEAWSLRATKRNLNHVNLVSAEEPREAVTRAIMGGGRTVLLAGETGCGKTQLALHSTREMTPRVIMDASLTERMNDVGAILAAIGARTLIIDDLPPHTGAKALTMIKSLREAQANITVIITVMTSGSHLSLPGLRPGRVEEIVRVDLPTREDREKLLSHFGMSAEDILRVADRTNGWSPAFLRELSNRVAAGRDMERAMQSLQQQIEMMKKVWPNPDPE